MELLENIRQYSFDMNMVDAGLINVFDVDVLYSWLGLDKATFDLTTCARSSKPSWTS